MNSAFGDIWHMCGSQLSFEGKFGQNLELVEVSHELNRDLWQGECVTPNSHTAIQSAGGTMGDVNATCSTVCVPPSGTQLPPCEGGGQQR